MVSKRL